MFYLFISSFLNGNAFSVVDCAAHPGTADIVYNLLRNVTPGATCSCCVPFVCCLFRYLLFKVLLQNIIVQI